MTTTTLRLPEDLKQRVAELAERSGQSVHAFLVEAVAARADEVEARECIAAEADERHQRMLASGEGIDWHEMRAWLQDRAAGKTGVRPRAQKWRE